MTGPRIVERRQSVAWAWQWDGSPECADLITNWVEENGGFAALHPHEPLIILGDQIAPAKPGDWIVRDKFNEYWPLPDDVFQATYRSLTE